jgi:transcriptional regulator with XRE-family HTH domain
MSSAFLEISTTFLADNISRLRTRLGLSQEGLARKLGCPLRSYQRWEKGESEPGGTWLLKMLRVAADAGPLAETLRDFGLDIEKFRDQYPSSQVAREGAEESLAPPPQKADLTPEKRTERHEVCIEESPLQVREPERKRSPRARVRRQRFRVENPL